MNVIDKAFQTQLAHIQAKTGKSLYQIFALIHASGLTRHGEIREMLKQDLGLGYGDANTLARFYLQPTDEANAQAQADQEDAAQGMYVGSKAVLYPIHVALIVEINKFGPYEIAPKKGYISLRRKKQFAMVGPATNTRVEVGLNMKGVDATPRLAALPAGGMCQYKVNVTRVEEVDTELVEWLRRAYESAG
jgi:hypothetical protein